MDSTADYLREHRFKALFTESLGWEQASSSINVSVAGRDFAFASIAHKRGLQVLLCSTDHLALLNRGLLRKVQKTVAGICHEHILIFCCELPRKQVWQWAIRLPDGRKLRHQEHLFVSASPPTTFLGRLSGLRFTLSEEEDVTLIDALERVRQVLGTSSGLNPFVRRPWYAERSAELFAAMQRGEEGARHRFLVFHLPLARKLSKRLCYWFGMLPEDAEQIGFLGLMEAARRYRPELGYQFSTYATYWVKQVCQRFGPDFALLIRLPVHVMWSCFRLHLSLERMAGEVGSAGVRDYLAELELSDPRTSRHLRDFERATAVRSLSDRKEPEYRAARRIAEVVHSSPDDMKRRDQAETVQRLLEQLPAREAQIIRLRYGFDACPAQTLEEIGQFFGLSKERIRQLQRRAEHRLHWFLSEGLKKPKQAADRNGSDASVNDLVLAVRSIIAEVEAK